MSFWSENRGIFAGDFGEEELVLRKKICRMSWVDRSAYGNYAAFSKFRTWLESNIPETLKLPGYYQRACFISVNEEEENSQYSLIF
jgi:hypothetical protein